MSRAVTECVIACVKFGVALVTLTNAGVIFVSAGVKGISADAFFVIAPVKFALHFRNFKLRGRFWRARV
jgi:hypothetical protein